MKHTSLLLLSLLAALLIPCACQKDIPVTDIFIQPASATLFVGESLDLSIQCYPEDATNTDELQVYSTNESIVSYANGRITAKTTEERSMIQYIRIRRNIPPFTTCSGCFSTRSTSAFPYTVILRFISR